MTIAWNEGYSTGNEIVDRQHRLLIANINELGKLLEEPSLDIGKADEILEFLGGYAPKHFMHEEFCMHRAHCLAAAKNQAEHEAFIDAWSKFSARLQAQGTDRELLREVHAYVADWITSHILRIDIQLRACVH